MAKSPLFSHLYYDNKSYLTLTNEATLSLILIYCTCFRRLVRVWFPLYGGSFSSVRETPIRKWDLQTKYSSVCLPETQFTIKSICLDLIFPKLFLDFFLLLRRVETEVSEIWCGRFIHQVLNIHRHVWIFMRILLALNLRIYFNTIKVYID